MAVSKLWPVTVRLATVLDYASNPEKTTKSKSKYSDADYQALRDVVAYAKDGEKTERELFCEGIHCNPQTAREQFITVKEQFDKPDGIQAYHGYLSFEETDITPELAQQVGMAFAERMWGDRFQVLVTTHLNTEQQALPQMLIMMYGAQNGITVKSNSDSELGMRLVAYLPELHCAVDIAGATVTEKREQSVKAHICQSNRLGYYLIKRTADASQMAAEIKTLFIRNHIYLHTDSEKDVQVLRERFLEWKYRNACKLNGKY